MVETVDAGVERGCGFECSVSNLAPLPPSPSSRVVCSVSSPSGEMKSQGPVCHRCASVNIPMAAEKC